MQMFLFAQVLPCEKKETPHDEHIVVVEVDRSEDGFPVRRGELTPLPVIFSSECKEYLENKHVKVPGPPCSKSLESPIFRT